MFSSIADLIVAISALWGAGLSTYMLIDQRNQRRKARPLTLAEQRREAELRMTDSCDVLRKPDPNHTGLDNWNALYTLPCRIDRSFQVSHEEWAREQPMTAINYFGVILRWPVFVPHGSDVRRSDHLVVRLPGQKMRRLRIVRVLGPSTDEVMLEVHGEHVSGWTPPQGWEQAP
jgi:hypothetical protein